MSLCTEGGVRQGKFYACHTIIMIINIIIIMIIIYNIIISLLKLSGVVGLN